MEKLEFLDRAAEDDMHDDEQADSASRSASTRLDSLAETEDNSRPSSAMSNMSQCGRKHRCPNGLIAMTQLKVGDFWSMVENWFTARTDASQLGSSWSMPGWTKYVFDIY